MCVDRKFFSPEVKWKKAYRAVTNSPKAMKTWTNLAKALEIDDGLIDEINQKIQISQREKVWEVRHKQCILNDEGEEGRLNIERKRGRLNHEGKKRVD